jgi:hypothetical protein
MKPLPFACLIGAAFIGVYFLFFWHGDISHAHISGPRDAVTDKHPAIDEATRSKALGIAHDHVRSNFPAWSDGLSRPWSVSVEGSTLVAREELPKGMIGGGAVVVLDRVTLKVVRVYHEQ